ncbi:MAG: transposase [Zoogloeaceae bacterium]|nr:transposase [Zoogloeaceae bacterium]
MHIGIQFQAPEGFLQFRKGEVYHFLKNDYLRNRVHAVKFEHSMHGSSQVRAHLITVEGNKFEEAADKGLVTVCTKQSKLPPWLSQYEDQGLILSGLDNTRANPVELHASRVGNRLLAFSWMLDEVDEVLSAEDPALEINRRARMCTPKQNESRFRLWLLTYLCFGRDEWVLMPPFKNIGQWDRYRIKGKKFGRPSRANGSGFGHGMTAEISKKCTDGYYKFAELGVTMTKIFREVLREFFGCKTRTAKSGMEEFYHPKGDPFPSYYQFRYQVIKDIGVYQVQKTRYGEVRHRSRLAPVEGSFSEAVANLMEKVEADGYYTNDRPKGYVEGSSLPKLCCVVCRDVLSGELLGIGFSFGKERSTAYRGMLFCMAVPKVFFCALFGIKIEEYEWACQGLSGHLILDRGPGAKPDLIKVIEMRLPIREITPSWSGQSKAGVESSHERETQTEGQPSYRQSDLTPVQMARREILRVVRYNHVADMSGRFQPDGEMAFLPPTPAALWDFYNKRFRNDAQMISIEEAVRTFLTPVKLDLRKDGIWLDEQRYSSQELKESGALAKLARSPETVRAIDGYMLDMCVRHIWIELDGRLLMLDAMLRHRDDEEKLFLSRIECQQFSEARRKVESEFRQHQHAATAKYEQRFEECTGKKWHAGRRIPGKPKRNATARQEEREARHSKSSRQSA